MSEHMLMAVNFDFRLPNNSHAPSNILLVHTFIIVPLWLLTPKDTRSQTTIDLAALNMYKDEAKT